MPWAGRTLLPNPFTGDEGARAPGLARALTDWAAARRDGAAPADLLRAEARVVAQLAAARVFAPVVAVLGEQDVVAAGPAGDKSADMALALLTQPDGRRGLPLFTDLAALAAWRADARPVPVPAARAALSGVQEGCEVLVLDPAGPVRFVVRRTALWALAREHEWVPAPFDGLVEAAVGEALAGVPSVRGVRLEAAEHAELRLVVGVAPGLDREGLARLSARLGERLGASDVVADRVDSLELRLLPAP
ncbi:SseB family protein [Kineococcus indalonis]|uniref:SseB family protein n=1 Tax=Kineococcus indalonis TaxID=2696566 RepID=UPI00196AFEDF|nr:SseB family protein [Kineococcus indalonis]